MGASAQSQGRLCTICGARSSTGAGFLQVLRFPLPILIPQNAPYTTNTINQGWYHRSTSGCHTKWTRSHPISLIKEKKLKHENLEEEGRVFTSYWWLLLVAWTQQHSSTSRNKQPSTEPEKDYKNEINSQHLSSYYWQKE
jgi:hypothetical protein